MRNSSLLVTLLFFIGFASVWGFEAKEHDAKLTPASIGAFRFKIHDKRTTCCKLRDYVDDPRNEFTYGQLMALPDYYATFSDYEKSCVCEQYDVRHAIMENSDIVGSVRGQTRFIAVAYSNKDHFHPQAPVTWRTLHEQAIAIAWGGDLNKALAVNAFADHFLADSFATGHMIDIAHYREEITKFAGGIKGWWQHRGLNSRGLRVRNSEGTEWTTYGDGYGAGFLGLIKDFEHYQIIKLAIELSIDDIYLAHQKKSIPLSGRIYRAERKIPIKILNSDMVWGVRSINPRVPTDGDNCYDTIDNTATGGYFDIYDSEIKARNITIKSGANVTFGAGNRIILRPGFKVENGAKFRAYIDPSLR